MEALLAVIGCFFATIVYQMIGELVWSVVWRIARPIHQPIWRAFHTARWPWPLILVMAAGLGGAWFALRSVDPEHPWSVTLGVIVFLLGVAMAITAPFLWRDARRERRQHPSSSTIET
jgi:hypothetical protein